jgi:hypothetical protein
VGSLQIIGGVFLKGIVGRKEDVLEAEHLVPLISSHINFNFTTVLFST